ncbi:SH3 and PX domain-containing protein 2B-like isoform X2 [Haliotis cracherodii]|uniref:SH3 and PX domain-containing protein 2B-like isoform X2 n=1 Tax=Haliotis cracherodii TaxID=6455 RepID=UPI0039E8A9CD
MKTIRKVTVVGVEKRRHPRKHYVYVIHVTWSEGGQHVIYRRYSRFFDLQCENILKQSFQLLKPFRPNATSHHQSHHPNKWVMHYNPMHRDGTVLNKFPIEAGVMEPSQRIIPILPGKILFGRSHIREVALKRLKPIDEYCQLLLDLPEQISQCEEVLSFFEVEDEDLEAPKVEEYDRNMLSKLNKISKPKQLKQYVAVSNYTKQEIGEIDLQAGMVLEVMEQSESGWWFVSTEDQQGWVPSTFLRSNEGFREDSTTRAKPGEEWKYICIEPFQSGREDELCLDRGSVVEVVEKNLVGWWLVRHQSEEGWVPASYLCKINNNDPVGEVAIIGKLSNISKLIQTEDGISLNDGHTAEVISGGPKQGIYGEVKKTRSLKTGGSLRSPPPRPNSVETKTVIICDVNIQEQPDSYITVADFQDTVGDGISFSAGRIVTVHEKAAGGWWYVEIDGHEGWAPSSYIKKSSIKIGSDCDDMSSSDDHFEQSSSKVSEFVKKEYDHFQHHLHFGMKGALPSPKRQACSKPPMLPKQKSKSINLMCQDHANNEQTSLNKVQKTQFESCVTHSDESIPQEQPEERVIKMFSPVPPNMGGNLKTLKPVIAKLHLQLPIKSTIFDGGEKDDITSKQTHVSSTATGMKYTLDGHCFVTGEIKKPNKESVHKQSAASKFGKKPSATGALKPQVRPKPKDFAHLSVHSRVLQSAGVVRSYESRTKEVKEIRQPDLRGVHNSYKVSSLINALDGQLVLGGASDIPRQGIPTENKASNVKDGSGSASYPLPTALDHIDHSTLSKSTKTVFKTVSIFTAENEGEIGFDEDEVVDVVEKSDEGWWLIRISGRGEGWAPAEFIKEHQVSTPRLRPTLPPRHKVVLQSKPC